VESESIRIRAFTPADYPAYSALWNETFPDEPRTAEELRLFDDEESNPRYDLHRYVAERPGATDPVALARYSIAPAEYDPGTFWIAGLVHPRHRGRGIGSALYERLLGELADRGIRRTRVSVRGDHSPGLRFVARRGFRELRRCWRLELRLPDFRPERVRDAAASLAAQGLRLRSLSEEGPQHPEVRRRLWEVLSATQADEPRDGTFTPQAFADFERIPRTDPGSIPDAWWIAKDRAEYVGVTAAYRALGSPGILNQGFTGVRREYRRRGVALALKRRVLVRPPKRLPHGPDDDGLLERGDARAKRASRLSTTSRLDPLREVALARTAGLALAWTTVSREARAVPRLTRSRSFETPFADRERAASGACDPVSFGRGVPRPVVGARRIWGRGVAYPRPAPTE
jgi:mycothiol synthase